MTDPRSTPDAASRLLLALLLLIADAVAFVVPLTALVAAYVIVARPAWFRDWVDQLYGPR